MLVDRGRSVLTLAEISNPEDPGFIEKEPVRSDLLYGNFTLNSLVFASVFSDLLHRPSPCYPRSGCHGHGHRRLHAFSASHPGQQDLSRRSSIPKFDGDNNSRSTKPFFFFVVGPRQRRQRRLCGSSSYIAQSHSDIKIRFTVNTIRFGRSCPHVKHREESRSHSYYWF